MIQPVAYRGRFAPSPTGPLHFGSLVAAVASYCEARSRGGAWLVRMEDLDTPRTMPGAADAILRMLDAAGFEWDGEVLYQSTRSEAYAEALERLRRDGHTFGCACTRREIADSALGPGGEAIYPGTCRAGLAPGRTARAERVRVDDVSVAFDDRVQGRIVQRLGVEVGDFVLRRADGLFAYQLAVVVDDATQGITDIVRGADLLHSTARQVFLQQLLGLPRPGYAHVPVATNEQGEKLSKQTLAAPLDDSSVAGELHSALRFLGQEPPAYLIHAACGEIWTWAFAGWSLDRVPRERALPQTAAR